MAEKQQARKKRFTENSCKNGTEAAYVESVVEVELSSAKILQLNEEKENGAQAVADFNSNLKYGEMCICDLEHIKHVLQVRLSLTLRRQNKAAKIGADVRDTLKFS